MQVQKRSLFRVNEMCCTFIQIFRSLFLRQRFQLNKCICSGNGLAPNRRQATIWTNAVPVHWCLYMCICVCVYIYIYIYIYTYTHTHTYIYICGTGYQLLRPICCKGSSFGDMNAITTAKMHAAGLRGLACGPAACMNHKLIHSYLSGVIWWSPAATASPVGSKHWCSLCNVFVLPKRQTIILSRYTDMCLARSDCQKRNLLNVGEDRGPSTPTPGVQPPTPSFFFPFFGVPPPKIQIFSPYLVKSPLPRPPTQGPPVPRPPPHKYVRFSEPQLPVSSKWSICKLCTYFMFQLLATRLNIYMGPARPADPHRVNCIRVESLYVYKSIKQSHKSHDTLVPYPTMQHASAHIYVTKWCIVRYFMHCGICKMCHSSHMWDYN